MTAFGDITLLPVGSAPEDVLVDARGRVYTGLEDGRIVRLDGPGAAVRTVATVPGRPLGLEFPGPDELLVCASDAGLLAVTLDGGSPRRGPASRSCSSTTSTATRTTSPWAPTA